MTKECNEIIKLDNVAISLLYEYNALGIDPLSIEFDHIEFNSIIKEIIMKLFDKIIFKFKTCVPDIVNGYMYSDIYKIYKNASSIIDQYGIIDNYNILEILINDIDNYKSDKFKKNYNLKRFSNLKNKLISFIINNFNEIFITERDNIILKMTNTLLSIDILGKTLGISLNDYIFYLIKALVLYPLTHNFIITHDNVKLEIKNNNSKNDTLNLMKVLECKLIDYHEATYYILKRKDIKNQINNIHSSILYVNIN